MDLTDSDLALLRDEIGTGIPPTDDDLHEMYLDLGHASWIPTALRVLRRRRSTLSTSEVRNISLPGGLAVGLSSNLSSLDRQIDRLEKQLSALDPDEAVAGVATESQITRAGYR